MKFKKTVISIFLFIVVITLTACGKESDKRSIVCTIFPEYDWVCEVLGNTKEDFEIDLLLDNGVDLHSYNPTIEDIAKISKCDLFIYVGGESDEWVEDVLKNAFNKEMKVICLMDVLSDKVLEEEEKEGMEEEEHEHEEDHEHEEIEYDEHVWLSLKNAEIIVQEIANQLSLIIEDNKTTYSTNATRYISELNNLDNEYVEAINEGVHKTIVFGDRFPFLYLFKDYGLDYYAAFIGCSSETEASFETIYFLTNKVDELGVNAILIIDGSDGSIASTIKESTKAKNQEILVLNSLQSTQTNSDDSYLKIMQANLEIIKKAIK